MFTVNERSMSALSFFLLHSSRPKDRQKSLCLSLFLDLCAGVSTECFILKNTRMLYCYFNTRFPVCSVQNSTEKLRCVPASARFRSLAYLFQRAPDCWSRDRADMQRSRPAEINPEFPLDTCLLHYGSVLLFLITQTCNCGSGSKCSRPKDQQKSLCLSLF